MQTLDLNLELSVSITSITQKLSKNEKGKYFAFFGLRFQFSLSSNLRAGMIHRIGQGPTQRCISCLLNIKPKFKGS